MDTTERTDLVTSGMFAVVRKPIFTAMLTVMLGLALLVPTGVTVAALLCLFLAVEIQVRLVEESNLLRTHGPAYTRYAQRVGRFLPGLGTLAPHPSQADERPRSPELVALYRWGGADDDTPDRRPGPHQAAQRGGRGTRARRYGTADAAL
ncbi:methyltransferase family protein [Georgenia sp. Z1344]|uniref:methyltransferase family protein n=1 Tax=Georgenia sp. Z1344 TaxID=3416706 RepID=UPI003CF29838